MAEIPVQRRGGIPWWVWLVAALIAVALLIWIFSSNNRNAAGVSGVNTPAVQANAGVVTTIAEAMTASPGQQVALTRVPVLRVVGDRGFVVGGSPSSSVFVVLDQVPTPNTSVEGRYDVTSGQMVDINGVMRSVQDIPGSIEDLPADTSVVVYAQNLSVAS